MELRKGQKQGRDERMQKDYQTSAKILNRCPIVLLCSFFFPSLHSFSRVFNTTFQTDNKHAYCAADERLVWGERLRFALAMNVLVVEMKALKARVQTSVPHNYTCSYQ